MKTESVLIPALLSNKASQQLGFNEEGLTIRRNFVAERPVFIPWQNIAALRLGASSIKGLFVNVGCQYIIELKDDSGTVHHIKLNSIYGIRRKQYEQLWAETFHHLFEYYFNDLLNYYTELHQIGQLFTLGNVDFYADGISLGSAKLLWQDIELNYYSRYFVIRHKQQVRQRKFLYYATDWNAYLLVYLLKRIVKSEGQPIRKRPAHE